MADGEAKGAFMKVAKFSLVTAGVIGGTMLVIGAPVSAAVPTIQTWDLVSGTTHGFSTAWEWASGMATSTAEKATEEAVKKALAEQAAQLAADEAAKTVQTTTLQTIPESTTLSGTATEALPTVTEQPEPRVWQPYQIDYDLLPE